jgi:hypothetical protein
MNLNFIYNYYEDISKNNFNIDYRQNTVENIIGINYEPTFSFEESMIDNLIKYARPANITQFNNIINQIYDQFKDIQFNSDIVTNQLHLFLIRYFKIFKIVVPKYLISAEGEYNDVIDVLIYYFQTINFNQERIERIFNEWSGQYVDENKNQHKEKEIVEKKYIDDLNYNIDDNDIEYDDDDDIPIASMDAHINNFKYVVFNASKLSIIINLKNPHKLFKPIFGNLYFYDKVNNQHFFNYDDVIYIVITKSTHMLTSDTQKLYDVVRDPTKYVTDFIPFANINKNITLYYPHQIRSYLKFINAIKYDEEYKNKIAEYYGYRFLHDYYNNKPLLEHTLNSILKPSVLYVSFIDGGNNFISSNNCIHLLNFYNLNKPTNFKVASDFPTLLKISHDFSSAIPTYINEPTFKSLGRTIYLPREFDLIRWTTIINDIKNGMKSRNKYKHIDLNLNPDFIKDYLKTININDDDLREFINFGFDVSATKNTHYHIAYKILKATENVETLKYEMNIMTYMKKNYSNIFPYILGASTNLFKLELSQQLINQLEQNQQVGKFKINNEYIAVQYVVKSSSVDGKFVPADFYLDYLEDCEKDKCDFLSYSKNNIKQATELINNNLIHSSLVNIYHSLHGDRLYMPSATIYNVHDKRYGVGRLNAVIEAAKYSNFRYNGVADFAEIIPMDEFKKKIIGEIIKTNNISNQFDISPHKNRLIELEGLSNQLLSWLIILAKYTYDKVIKYYSTNDTFSDLYIKKNRNRQDMYDLFSKEIKNCVFGVFCTVIETYMHINDATKYVNHFFSEKILTQIANQLIYFTSYEYIHDFTMGKIKNVYDAETITVLPHIVGLNDLNKFIVDGKLDIKLLGTNMANKEERDINRGWGYILFTVENKPVKIFSVGWCLSMEAKINEILDKLNFVGCTISSILAGEKSIIIIDSNLETFNNLHDSTFDINTSSSSSNAPPKNNSIDFYLWKVFSQYMDMGAVNGSMPHLTYFNQMIAIFTWAILVKKDVGRPTLSNIVHKTIDNINNDIFAQTILELQKEFRKSVNGIQTEDQLVTNMIMTCLKKVTPDNIYLINEIFSLAEKIPKFKIPRELKSIAGRNYIR